MQILLCYYCGNPNVTWDFVWDNYKKMKHLSEGKDLFKILSETFF